MVKLTDRQEDALLDQQIDCQCDIEELIRALIIAEWDSKTLKSKLELKIKELDEILSELHP
jgi:hypothetical protein